MYYSFYKNSSGTIEETEEVHFCSLYEDDPFDFKTIDLVAFNEAIIIHYQRHMPFPK